MHVLLWRSQKRALDLLELELRAVHSSGLLGTKLGSSARAESSLQPSPGQLQTRKTAGTFSA